MKCWDVLQDLIPYVWKLAFSYIPLEVWVIDLDVHGLLDGPSDDICLPAYNNETVNTDKMSNGLVVLVDGGGDSEMFFEPIPKGLSNFWIYSSSHSALVYLYL